MTDRRFVEATPGGFALNDPRVYGDGDIPGVIMNAVSLTHTLRDLSWHGAFEKADGYWPIAYDATVPGEGEEVVWSYALDVADKSVKATGKVVSILPPAMPRILGRLDFTTLAQTAGGMTDAMLINAYKHPAFEAFWIKFQLASEVKRDHLVTVEALLGLEAAGFLPNGAQAVIDAWPVE